MMVKMLRLFFIACCVMVMNAGAALACPSASDPVGKIIYNESERVFQGCLSSGWVALGVPGEDARLNDGLVGYWKLDETSGPTVADSSSLGHNGTLVNLSLPGDSTNGVFKNAINFFDASTSDPKIELPDDVYKDLSAITVSAWVNFREFTGFEYVLSVEDVFELSTLGSDNRLLFRANAWDGVKGAWNAGYGNFSLPQYEWVHVAVTYDFNQPVGTKPIMYVNAVANDNPDVGSGPTGNYIAPLTARATIGDRIDATDRADIFLDEVRLYDRVLSQSEIYSLYGMGRGAVGPCDTVGQVCADGTVYAGTSPDGTVPMYTTRCDAGQTWDGTACTGTHESLPFNNGNTSGFVNSAAASSLTAGSNNTTVLVKTDSDSDTPGFQPHQAAQYCHDLDIHGHRDWYLPARNEVAELCTNRVEIGNFASASFISSTDIGINDIHHRNFSTCASGGTNQKGGSFRVRCVRKSEKPTSCFSPSGVEGQIVYNSDEGVFQGCVGSHWEALHEPAYVPNSVEFDGTGDYLTQGGSFIDAVDGRTATGSFWFKLDAAGEGGARMFFAMRDRFFSQVQSNGRITIRARNSSGSDVFQALAGSGDSFDGNHSWNHFMFSIDMDNLANNRYYLNGAPFAMNETGAGGDDIDFTSTDYNIGAFNVGSNIFHGDLADLWVETNLYLDLSVEANRRKFIDANGFPVYLGENGERVTGQAPDIFLSGDTADWHTNKGTGGGFTENGTLTDGDPVTKAGSPTIPTDGLVGHWKLDETSGTTAFDSSPSGLNGTYELNEVATEIRSSGGVIGRGMQFAGGNYSVSLGSPPELDFSGTNAFTISAWAKPAVWNDVAYSWDVIFTRGITQSGAPNGVYSLGMDPGANDWLIMFSNGTGYITARALTDNTIDVGVWQHVVGTWSGTELNLYKNGALIANNTVTTTLWDDNSAFTRQTAIGMDIRGDRNRFQGAIDDVRVYNRALTPAEITALYEQGRPCTSPVAFNGDLLFNTNEDTFQGCTRTGWKALHGEVP